MTIELERVLLDINFTAQRIAAALEQIQLHGINQAAAIGTDHEFKPSTVNNIYCCICGCYKGVHSEFEE